MPLRNRSDADKVKDVYFCWCVSGRAHKTFAETSISSGQLASSGLPGKMSIKTMCVCYAFIILITVVFHET